MADHFLIDDAKICALSATRQGRVSIGGFTYQASYAAARLASMLVRRPVLDLDDHPVALRYDWAEDLDEIDSLDRTIFTQCKRVNDIGQPAKLVDVLLSFAPKLLWTPPERRTALRFRIICTDPRFRGDAPLAFSANGTRLERVKVQAAFVEALSTPPSARSDRALWQAEATAYGPDVLFASIWEATEAFYLRGDVIVGDPSRVPLLAAERAALDILLRWRKIDTDRQPEALQTLRGLVHNNLVSFDPLSDLPAPPLPELPRIIRRPDVQVELFSLQTKRDAAFRIVGRQFLADQRAKAKRPYVARPPEWADVVHGQDQVVGFVERDLTTAILERVRSHILEPLARGTEERLRTLFVLGAPGSGKSTLVRRIAALLVEEGAVTVADFGPNLGAIDDDEIKTIISDLASLATRERPVLVVLDDPFFAESGWDTLLARLARSRLPVGVVGASPDYLYERFGGSIRHDPFATEVMSLAKPSGVERATLSRLHGRELRSSAGEDDFLVLAMEAAAGEPFSTIVTRIWTTLNDGQPIDSFAEPETLPWPVRAYLITCYFHRGYERCPEVLLREALAQAGTAAPVQYDYRLSQLTFREGWSIFSVQEPAKGLERLSGRTIGAGHHRIASEAWTLRPLPAFDVADWVIPASIRCGQPYEVSRLAGTLVGSADKTDARFPARLANAWSATSPADVRGSALAALAGGLEINDARQEARLMIPALRRRAELMDGESWVAVLQLWHFSSLHWNQKTFPEDLDLARVIDVADFSIASTRAHQFARALGPRSSLYAAFCERLFRALEGSFHWTVDTNALTWLLARVPVSEITEPRLQHVRSWLGRNPDDTSVRAKFLDVVSTLPSENVVREEVFKDASLWLDQHPEDTAVRTRFITIIGRLGAEDELWKTVIESTALWLDQHPDDTTVRLKFLGLVEMHPADGFREMAFEKTVLWLDQHPHDSGVRAKFLGIVESLPDGHALRRKFMDGIPLWLEQHPDDSGVRTKFLAIVEGYPPKDALRNAVFEDTARWLEQHPEDSVVRTKFLDIVERLPFGHKLRNAAIKDTPRWLNEHPEDTTVRSSFLIIIAGLPAANKLRNSVLVDTARWLEQHPRDTSVRTNFLGIAGSTDLGFNTLVSSAELLDSLHGNRFWHSVADAMVQPYLRAAQSANERRDENAKKTLLAIRDSIARWYESVGTTRPDLDSMSPKSDHRAPRPSRGFNILAGPLRHLLGMPDDE